MREYGERGDGVGLGLRSRNFAPRCGGHHEPFRDVPERILGLQTSMSQKEIMSG